MILEHIGLSQINGSLVVLDDVQGRAAMMKWSSCTSTTAPPAWAVSSVMEGDRGVIQVFEGTARL